MIGYRFLSPAEEEMIEAVLFYEARSEGLGFEFFDEVQRLIELVREHPELGQAVGGFRRAVLRRFPFSLIYSHEPTEIVIIAVSHQSRRPGYWRDRADIVK